MKKVFVLAGFLTFLFQSYCKAQITFQADTLQARIVLIGDAGEFTKGKQPVILGVQKAIPFDSKTTIIFLGDNVYNIGLPDEASPNYNLMRAVLDSQIHIADNTKAKVYFMPGNHDWNNGNPRGLESIERQQQYVDNTGRENVKFYPEDGCPGPVEISISPDVTLVIMDSEWWVYTYDKPGIESDCPCKTKSEVLTNLDNILSRNSKKLVLITFHHTLKSYGVHGGFYTLKQHIFPLTDVNPKLYIPLPIIGSIYPITRGVFGTSEDLSHPLYASMIADIEKVVKGHQNVIFAAGHEHTLQLIKDSGYFYMVSGAGSKSTRVNKNKNLLFGVQKNGFATLEISKNKNVNTTYYTVDSNIARIAYSSHLLNFSTIPTPQNPNDTVREVEFAFKDSVIISASDKYKNVSGFRKKFLGNNYRPEWSAPIQLKEFNLRKEKGGFKIISLGGGTQTRSLTLQDKAGKQWILRIADKNPENLFPEELGGVLPANVFQDMVSASNPYAPLVIPDLAKATDVIFTNPQYFFVPDDPAFDIYRKLFANTVCLLRLKDPVTNSRESKTTAKVISKLSEDHDNHTDQQAYLRARLLDNVNGDYDRHPDQWEWDTRDTGKGKLYYPIPINRDQAFFNSDGILINYLAKNQFKYLEGFGKNIKNPAWFNWQARDVDRLFLNLLNENEWKSIIDTFQQNLTDKVIDSAMKKFPPEIYPMDAKKLSDKIKSRRDKLMNSGMSLYKFLSKKVNIVGSNQDEYFKVQNNGDSLQVIVYRKKKTADSAGIMYNRTFDPRITKEIRLYGLNGNDKFEIVEGTSSKIKVRIIGGKGDDTFNIKGNVRNYIYDIKSTDTTSEKNGIISSSRSRIELLADPLVNEYSPYGMDYTVHHFPQLNIGYNTEDQLLVGGGFSVKTFGFRKDPYATFQQLSALFATNHSSYQLKYQGIFTSAFMKKDVVVNAALVNPTLNNFFGFGNSTIRSNPTQFYRVRYSYAQADVLLRKGLNNHIIDFSFGPSYFHYWNKYSNNKGTILASPAVIGLDSSRIYNGKDYLGLKLKADINFVNDEQIPSRGITWYNEVSTMAGMNSNSNTITKFTSNMTVYGSLTEERKAVAILRVGGGHIFTKNFEYFQALTLGGDDFLRGFRKDRFSGSSLLYSSAEVRLRLFKSQSYFLPGDFGVIGFYDLGRVWMRNEISNQWHQSFGGGFYFTPYNILVISATIGISDEDNLFNFSLGTKFRLTF